MTHQRGGTCQSNPTVTLLMDSISSYADTMHALAISTQMELAVHVALHRLTKKAVTCPGFMICRQRACMTGARRLFGRLPYRALSRRAALAGNSTAHWFVDDGGRRLQYRHP